MGLSARNGCEIVPNGCCEVGKIGKPEFTGNGYSRYATNYGFIELLKQIVALCYSLARSLKMVISFFY